MDEEPGTAEKSNGQLLQINPSEQEKYEDMTLGFFSEMPIYLYLNPNTSMDCLQTN